MRHSLLTPAALVFTGIASLVGCTASAATGGEAEGASKPSIAAPLMQLLDRFIAPEVPALARSETAVTKLTGKPQPDGLPGKGMAEHPMLVIGEGFNSILLSRTAKSFGRTRPAGATNMTMSGCSLAATFSSPARSMSPR